jgi:hypothetical protein
LRLSNAMEVKKEQKKARISALNFLFARKSSWPAIIGSEKLAVQ